MERFVREQMNKSESKEFKVQGLHLDALLPQRPLHNEGILFIPGSGLNSKSGRPILESLAADGYRSFSLSLRGHTGSEIPTDFHRTGLADYATDTGKVSSFIQQEFGINRGDQIIFGHSMGGIIAMEHAKQGAKAVVLLSSGVPFEMTPEFLKVLKIDTKTVALQRQQMEEAVAKGEVIIRTQKDLERWFSGKLPTDFEQNREMYLQILSQESYQSRLETYLKPFSVRPEQISCPILVVGADNDQSVPPAISRQMAQYFATDYLEANGSHMFMFEDDWPDTAQRIKDWLEK
ncbi:MAG: alpha/beta fold hydrolase [Candidatus Jacksonbacteria bacterium]